MTVTIIGLEKVQVINQNLMDKKKYQAAINDIIKKTKKEIIKNAPVGATGDLVKSVTSGGRFPNRYIEVGVPYAQFMEWGTIYFPVGSVNAPRARTSTSGKPCYHPFIRPAVWKQMKEAKDRNIYFKAMFKR